MPSVSQSIRGAAVPVLHVVTDDAVLARDAFPEVARRVMEAGGRALALHVRGPRTPGDALFRLSGALVQVARTTGAMLAVNGRVDVALCAGVGAVHLGRRGLTPAQARGVLGPDSRVGVSTHDGEEAAAAHRDGADWIFAGTIWETPSHPARPGGGIAALEAAVAGAAGRPVLAIGGVTPERAALARQAGAHGVAVIRGVWDASDPTRAVNDYLGMLASGAGGKTTTG